MVEAHPLPAALEPHAHEHGLASGEVAPLAASVDRAWELFEQVARQADLSAPSRKQGLDGRAIVAQLGQWEVGRTLADLIADAHEGDVGYVDADAIDARVVAATAELDDDTVIGGITAARAAIAEWLASDGPATWGLVHTSSPLGPLPVLTVVNAASYQLAIAARDLRPTGVEEPLELLHLGMVAMVDTVGALAGRAHVTGSFTAVTPELVVGVGATAGRWRTSVLAEDPRQGPAVHATAPVVLDVTRGRVNTAALYRSGDLRVHDLPGLIRLAPVLEGVPGMPPVGAIGRALQLVDAVGGLFGRLRR